MVFFPSLSLKGSFGISRSTGQQHTWFSSIAFRVPPFNLECLGSSPRMDLDEDHPYFTRWAVDSIFPPKPCIPPVPLISDECFRAGFFTLALNTRETETSFSNLTLSSPPHQGSLPPTTSPPTSSFPYPCMDGEPLFARPPGGHFFFFFPAFLRLTGFYEVQPKTETAPCFPPFMSVDFHTNFLPLFFTDRETSAPTVLI